MSTLSEITALNKVGKGGADLSLPNRGTTTGMNGDTYGADVSVDATNSLGGLGSKTGSDEAMEDCPGC